MRGYRLYCINEGGHISMAELFAAGSNEEAILKARQSRPNGLRAEVWRQTRLIATISQVGRLEVHESF